MAFPKLVLKVMQNHFCQTTFMEAVSRFRPGSVRQRAPLPVEVRQSSQRVCEMGNPGAAIFGKYNLSKPGWNKKTSMI